MATKQKLHEMLVEVLNQIRGEENPETLARDVMGLHMAGDEVQEVYLVYWTTKREGEAVQLRKWDVRVDMQRTEYTVEKVEVVGEFATVTKAREFMEEARA